MNNAQASIFESLVPFGGAAAQIRLCDEHLSAFDYADIVASARPLPIEAVVEIEKRPVLYVVRESLFLVHTEQNIDVICRRLACRGEQAFFGIIKPGSLELFPCLLTSKRTLPAISIKEDSQSAPSLVYNLGQGLPPQGMEKAYAQMRAQTLRQAIFEIFINAGEKIRDSCALKQFTDDAKTSLALALIGRALFMRFLLDRGLIRHDSAPSLFANDTPEQFWFSTPNSAAQICEWLDCVFNGDLLPFPMLREEGVADTEKEYQNYFEKLINSDPTFLKPLTDIIVGEKNNVQHILLRLLDFSHIPVGLLSEAYDYFIHKFSPSTAQKQSTHFTPRHIAETVVEQAFNALCPEKRIKATVLDPAAGAGIFLILSLKRLAKEYLHKHGTLDTPAIRVLLYEHIRGYDINPHALTLATLALYLTAIEIDPKPDPVTKLKFPQKLIGHVLHDVSQIHPTLGSLASDDSKLPGNKYDIVLGNPPWTRKKEDKELADITNSIAKRVLSSRVKETQSATVRTLLSETLAKTTNYSAGYMPDIPFFWRALELAKPNAVIAFVTHARILFRIDYALEAREALFRAMRVTGIVNCADLRKEHGIWPNISAQFCFIFGMNTPALPNDQFRYLSPYVDKALSGGAKIRFDPTQSIILSPFELESRKSILKMLFRGTMLDVSVYDKIVSNSSYTRVTIKNYCDQMGLDYGEGYNINGPKPQSTDALKKLNGKHLQAIYDGSILQESTLDDFNDANIDLMYRPKRASLYTPPLAMLTKSSLPNGCVYLGKKHLIFSEIYMGFSGEGHPQKDEFIPYLALLFKSSLLRYFALTQSSQFGIERDTLLGKDIYSFPFIPVEDLTDSDRLILRKLIARMHSAQDIQTLDVDSFIFGIYELDERDSEIIYDTLAVHLPGSHSFLKHVGGASKRGQAHPTGDDIECFCAILRTYINELTSFYHKNISYDIRIIPRHSLSQWLFFDIIINDAISSLDTFYEDFAQHVADNEGVTQIILHLENGAIRVGKLAQYRYWTRSQARILGQQILSAICDSWDRLEL